MPFKHVSLHASATIRDIFLGLHSRTVLHRATKALHSLDDYMLKDLGLARADIERISQGEDVSRFR
jgi:uncharacterized protein YjiS (DUF1127 family)